MRPKLRSSITGARRVVAATSLCALMSVGALTSCSSSKDSTFNEVANTLPADDYGSTTDQTYASTESYATAASTESPAIEVASDTAAAVEADQAAAQSAASNGYVETPAAPAGAPARVEAKRAPEQPGSNVWDEEAPTVPPATAPTVTQPNITARDAGVNPETFTAIDNESTFAMDVDTGSYTLARNLVQQGTNPAFDAVRTEEFVNYFNQNYSSPKGDDTFAIHVDGTRAPFLEPQRRVIRVGIQGRRVDVADRKPVRLTFVVDNSGSMEENGKLEIVKNAMKTLAGNLDRFDQIAIVGFSDNAWVVLGPTSAIERNRVDHAIDSMATTSSTNAEAGLQLGYQQAQAMFSKDAINRVVLLSDGVANVGPTGPEAILREIADQTRKGIDLNTIGVGTATYNDEMMERLADAGDGFYAYVDSQDEASRLFGERLTSTLETIARNAKVQVEFNKGAVASYRLMGFENRGVADSDFTNNKVDAGELGAGHSVTALYEVALTERADRGNERNLGTVKLRWEEPNGKVKKSEAGISMDLVSDSFVNASDYLRLDIVVAAFAEVLRQGPWSRFIELPTVATNAERLIDGRGAFRNDADVLEFSKLTKLAANHAGFR